MEGAQTVECAQGETAGRAWSREGVTRRGFLSLAGAGLLVSVVEPRALLAQAPVPSEAARASGGLLARLHVGADGVVTVMSGKVEVGQGSRTQLAMAVAEELGLSVDGVRVVLADTALVPDDGGTFGSQTTPRTVPAVRQAAAAARRILVDVAGRRMGVDADRLTVSGGAVFESAESRGRGRSVSFAELAASPDLERALATGSAEGVEVKRVESWEVLGAAVNGGAGAAKVGGREIVTGALRYPSDLKRPGMLYGAVLRAPTIGAKLVGLGEGALGSNAAIAGVQVVHDGDFAAVVAATSFEARAALRELETRARWEERPVSEQPSSDALEAVLRATAVESGAGGRDGPREWMEGMPDEAFAAAASASRAHRATYQVAYLQHAPMEPHAALAEWAGDVDASEAGSTAASGAASGTESAGSGDARVELTVWTGTQVPFGVRRQLAEHFELPPESVRVIVPDTGGAFGGKHTGEHAVEAARIARAVGKPVLLRWTREEEMAWAYFRPAGVIDLRAALDAEGRLAAWEQVNLNSGPSALRTPYRAANRRERYVPCESPLREGSYRALAATANTFAREAFLDELAETAGLDPLDFRLRNLDDARLRAVLEAAAARFGWQKLRASGAIAARRKEGRGIGLGCGTEKGSYVAACVEIAVDAKSHRIRVERVVQAFECGAVQNPPGLRAQVEGCVVMALGGALREEIRFAGGKVLDPRLGAYPVPRFSDLPEIEVVFVDRRDLPSAGAGETPMIALAPAIAGALYEATGVRARALPLERAWREAGAQVSSSGGGSREP